ncbi:MAG TPA: hypothetical protein PLZ79_13280 [Burkholderiales bacterium]|nr:hypothetical protein [Burkholderiales bacterium]
MNDTDDRQAIDALVLAFFAVFDNRGGRRPRLGALHELCLPECVIVKAGPDGPTIYGLEAFVAPRAALLMGGELTNFYEEEVEGRTDLFGGVAQRFCVYRKAGVLNGTAFAARGMKAFQFVKLPGGWRISAFAWEDERPGLAIPDQAV